MLDCTIIRVCVCIYIYIYIYIYTFWHNSPSVGQGFSSFIRFLDDTQWRTIVGRSPLDEWSARRRDLYLTTHNTHNKQTSMAPSGIRTHNLSRRAAADLRLRPRGYWDRHNYMYIYIYIYIYIYTLLISYYLWWCQDRVAKRYPVADHPLCCVVDKPWSRMLLVRFSVPHKPSLIRSSGCFVAYLSISWEKRGVKQPRPAAAVRFWRGDH